MMKPLSADVCFSCYSAYPVKLIEGFFSRTWKNGLLVLAPLVYMRWVEAMLQPGACAKIITIQTSLEIVLRNLCRVKESAEVGGFFLVYM